MSIKSYLYIFLLLSTNVNATKYYIDYLKGSDNSLGTSINAPWKHSPGDDNAIGIAKNCSLKGGDTLFFKGGVKYYGSIKINASGEKNKPIVFIGSKWGYTNAIIDGSERILAIWKRCTSLSEAGGNPNWQNIWYCDISSDIKSCLGINLHEEDSMLSVAQYPNPDDPFYYENISTFLNPQNITNTAITDSRLENLGGTSLVGKWCLVYQGNNTVISRLIKGYSKNAISFDSVSSPYAGTEARFALLNHIKFIDKPGEFSFSETPNNNNLHRIYLWPRTMDPNERQYFYSVKNYGIALSSCNYVTIEGFTIQKYSGDGDRYDGIGIGTVSSGPVSNIIIKHNTIRNNSFTSYGGLGGIYVSSGSKITIDSNNIKLCSRHRGIFTVSCEDVFIRGNYVTRMGLTGISNYTCKNSLIEGNTIKDVSGGHANGMSVYLYSDSILVIRNKIINSNICFAYEKSSNVWLVNNLFDGCFNTSYVAIFRNGSGIISLLCNTIINSSNHYSLLIQADADIILKNNILDGGGEESQLTAQTDRTNNLYVGLSWNQKPKYDWLPDERDVNIINSGTYNAISPSDVFHKYELSDYSLKVGSPAIDVGVPIIGLIPGYFAQRTDLSIDLDDNKRPYNTNWDIGAYEFNGKESLAPEPATGIGFTLQE